jgi:hypothetical protein
VTVHQLGLRTTRTPRDALPRLKTCFVIGPPRSGTTLLGYLLAGGDGVAALSEPFLAYAILPDWTLQRFFHNFQKSAGLRRCKPPHHADAERFSRFLHRMVAENGFCRLVIKETYRRHGLIPRWHNEALLDQLLGGNEPVVGLIRHPDDVAASTIKLARWVTGPRGTLVRIRARNLPGFRNTNQVVRWAADNWVSYVDWVRRHGLRIVRYEDLVQNPRQQLEAVCRHCRLEFEERMLDYAHARAVFGGLGDGSVLKTPRPIDRNSIGHGQRLTDAQRRVVREVCERAARDFDYTL